MRKPTIAERLADLPPAALNILRFLTLFGAFFLTELLAFCLLTPDTATPLLFGALWSGMLTGFILCLPRLAGRITFSIVYFFFLLWTLAQTGYDAVFGKMMWLSTIGYAGEGAGYLADVLRDFPALWWIGGALLIGLGILLIWKFPRYTSGFFKKLPYLSVALAFFLGLLLLPQALFAGEDEKHTPSVYHTAYTGMSNAKKVYDFTGIYQLTWRDFWVHEAAPLLPGYQSGLSSKVQVINEYFARRGESAHNEMTGIFAGKNVVLVLMESMDDWMITPDNTPTLWQLMHEGISFTNFYTPGYGSARTLNSEFCMNTGIYLPTGGEDVFDYLENSFDQSIASQLEENGYTGYAFHYNSPNFYSRGELEPAMGYESYVAYSNYVSDKKQLCDDNLLFDLPEVSQLFFREGPSFNTIITRAAHLGYTYNEIITHYALMDYPQYRGRYPSEEQDSAHLKAMLVDRMFARLLQELDARGQLENTVIIGMTDHYTYGYKNMDELYALSGVADQLLLEKVPCFVWSSQGPNIEVEKTLNTADLLPTMLNLLGINTPYSHLGQDAFDPDYEGYAIFPDGSWICDGVAWQNGSILMNTSGKELSQEEIDRMNQLAQEYIAVNNLLLTCNYYQ